MAKPIVIECTEQIPAPPDQLWGFLVDWERQGEWMLELSDLTVTSPHREGIGVTAEGTVAIGGIRTRDLIEVDVWEPHRHLGLLHKGWVKGRGDLVLIPDPDGTTRLEWREEFAPPLGVLGALGMRIFAPLIVRTFRRDIGELRKLLGSVG